MHHFYDQLIKDLIDARVEDDIENLFSLLFIDLDFLLRKQNIHGRFEGHCVYKSCVTNLDLIDFIFQIEI